MRNSNIELLRFVLMLGICLLHMLFLGRNLGAFSEGVGCRDLAVVTCVIPAVNVFMLISGYFGIKTTINKLVYFVAYGFVVYVCLWIVKTTLWHAPFSILPFIRNMFPISTFVWWFFTYYFMIMLLAPFVNVGCGVVSKKYFGVFLVLFFVINSCGLYWGRVSDGSNFQTLLFLYLLGRYISLYDVKLKRSLCAVLFFVCSAVFFALILFCYNKGATEVCRWLCCYNNPIVILSSVSVLLFVTSFKTRTNRFFNYLGKHSFLIYLLTTMPLFVWWGRLYDKSPLLCFVAILFVALFITMIDIPLTKLCKWFAKLLIDKFSFFDE